MPHPTNRAPFPASTCCCNGSVPNPAAGEGVDACGWQISDGECFCNVPEDVILGAWHLIGLSSKIPTVLRTQQTQLFSDTLQHSSERKSSHQAVSQSSSNSSVTTLNHVFETSTGRNRDVRTEIQRKRTHSGRGQGQQPLLAGNMNCHEKRKPSFQIMQDEYSRNVGIVGRQLYQAANSEDTHQVSNHQLLRTERNKVFGEFVHPHTFRGESVATGAFANRNSAVPITMDSSVVKCQTSDVKQRKTVRAGKENVLDRKLLLRNLREHLRSGGPLDVDAKPRIKNNQPESLQHRRTKKNRRRVWTREEDQQLSQGVAKYNTSNWDAVAEYVPNRTAAMCESRWVHVIDPNLKRGKWSLTEDLEMQFWIIELDADTDELDATHQEAAMDWDAISKYLPGRTGKQCRARWFGYLHPTLNRGPWQPAEDELIVRERVENGLSWCQIARKLSDRTDNMIKARFRSLEASALKSWTAEEDTRLLELHGILGNRWGELAARLGGNRSKNAISRRLKVLQGVNID